MAKCRCGSKCDYVGLIVCEGCTNPKCEFYEEKLPDTIPCPPNEYAEGEEFTLFLEQFIDEADLA